MRLHKPRWMFLLPPVALVLLLGISYVHGMGSGPSSCVNRYDGTITSISISYPGGSLNPMALPKANITIPAYEYFNLTFTIQSAPTSSLGSTQNGSVFYDTDIYGYGDGVCVPVTGGNTNVTVTLNDVKAPATYEVGVYPAYQYDVYTYADNKAGPEIQFGVTWTSTSTSTETSFTTGSPTISYTSTITIHNTSDFTGPTSTTSFFSSSSQQSASSQSASSSSSSSVTSITATSGTEKTTTTSFFSSTSSESSSTSSASVSSASSTAQSSTTSTSTTSSAFLSSESSQSSRSLSSSSGSGTTSSFLSGSSSSSSGSAQSTSSVTNSGPSLEEWAGIGVLVVGAASVALYLGVRKTQPSATAI